VANFQIVDSVP
jgi:hypothetical protein